MPLRRPFPLAQPTPLQLGEFLRAVAQEPYSSFIYVPGPEVVSGHLWPQLQHGPLAHPTTQAAPTGSSGTAEDRIATVGAGEPVIDDEESNRYTFVDIDVFRLGRYLVYALNIFNGHATWKATPRA